MDRAIYLARNMLAAALCCLAAVACVAGMCRTSCGADLPPSDRGLYQTIIVCPTGHPLAAAFQSDPKLSQLRTATAFTHFKQGDPLYVQRYQAILGTEFPIVVYADSAGRVIYSANRLNMPPASSLFAAIKAEHLKRSPATPAALPISAAYQEPQADLDVSDCPDGNCPVRNPLDPQPNRQPLFPNLQPLRHPFEGSDDATSPIDRIFNGAISNTVKTGIFMVFSFVALGIVFVFALILLASMFFLSRWMR